MDDFVGGCLAILLLVGMALVCVAFTVANFWPYLLLLALCTALILIIVRFHDQVAYALGAGAGTLGRGVVSISSAAKFAVVFTLTSTKRAIEYLIGWAAASVDNWKNRPKEPAPREYRQPPKTTVTDENSDNRGVDDDMNARVEVWNETEIAKELTQIQSRPTEVKSYIDSLRQRFIWGQQKAIAERRNAFLETEISRLKLMKEFLEHHSDIEIMPLEKEVREAELRKRKWEIEQQMKPNQDEDEIQQLDYQLRKAEKRAAIAKLEEDEFRTRFPPEPPSPEDKMKMRRAELEARIKKVKERIEYISNDSNLSEHMKTTQRSQLENKLFDLQAKLNDLL